jgi:hypothetical protein
MRLPPGFLGPTAGTYGIDSQPDFADQSVGELVHLLPYIEQQALFNNVMNGAPSDYLSPDKNFTTDGAAYGVFFSTGGFWANRTAQIKSLLCPADIGQTDAVGVIYSSYQASPTTFSIYITCLTGGGSGPGGTYTDMGKTNYIAIGGRSALSTDTYRGAFQNRSKNSIGRMQDGASNTLMFGEIAVKQVNFGGGVGKVNTVPMWLASGYFPTAWGTTNPPSPDTNWYMLSSRHPGIFMAGMCDGAVRTVRHVGTTTSPSYTNYIYASGMSDGNVFDANAL